jgi:hypothetical protein
VGGLRFALRVAKHVKSNAIVLARDGGDPSGSGRADERVDAARMAGWKAEESARAAGLAESLAGLGGRLRRLLPLRGRAPRGRGFRRDRRDPAGRLAPGTTR